MPDFFNPITTVYVFKKMKGDSHMTSSTSGRSRSSPFSRRRFGQAVLAAGGTALLAKGTSALAQTPAAPWPNRQIRMIVNFPAGGSPDAIARAVSTPLSQALGQTVVVLKQHREVVEA